MEVTYGFLINHSDYNGVVRTMVIDNNCFDSIHTFDIDLHIFAQIHLCNRYRIQCLKFVTPRFGRWLDNDKVSELCSLDNPNIGKFAYTVRSIIAESDSESFYSEILSQFIERSTATKVVCRLINIDQFAAYEIRTSIVKETNSYLREIHFEQSYIGAVDGNGTRIFTEFLLITPMHVEDKLLALSESINVMLRMNNDEFKLKKLSVIAILAITRYGKVCGIHKDTILSIARTIWNTI